MGARTTILLLALGAVGLTACARTAIGASGTPNRALAAGPTRRAGLWEQTMIRDGKRPRRAQIQVCLDGANDDRLWLFAGGLRADRCNHDVRRGVDGVYHFASSCRLGPSAVLTSSGVASGDFSSAYEVHSVLAVSGAPFAELDGRHRIEVVGRYRGPCPAGMAAGQVALGHGVKLDPRRLRQIAGI